MNTPVAPRPLPSHGWPTFGAVVTAMLGLGLLVLNHGRTGYVVGGVGLLVAAGLLVWLAIVRHAARGAWEEQMGRLGLRPAELGTATLEGLGSKHAILATTSGRGIERILRGRIHDRDVFVVQAYREIVPGPFRMLLSLLTVLFAAAAALAGSVVDGLGPGAPRKRTTVLLLPRQTNTASGEEAIGAWTVSLAPTSTAIYVLDRDIEPSNLRAFLEAAIQAFESQLAR